MAQTRHHFIHVLLRAFAFVLLLPLGGTPTWEELDSDSCYASSMLA